MAYPILEDSYLYGPLKDLRLKFGPHGTWEGGKDVTSFSVWLFPLKGVKAGPLILVGTESEPCPLLSLNSNNQILVHTGLDTAPGSGIFPHSERSLLLQKWTHMAVEVLGHTLRLVLDGRVEVETEISDAFFHTGPLLLSGTTKRNASLIYTYSPKVDSNGRSEEDVLAFPVQLILSPQSQNPKTASGTEILEFRPTTVDGEQVFAVVGGKPSCRRKFVIHVELVDAHGRCSPRELDVIASLVFADSELLVPSGGNGAEAPLLTTFDGVEFPSDEKPTRLVNGKASFKFTISQLASKCENRLFSICFQAYPPSTDQPFLRLLSKPIHSISRKRPHKSRNAASEERREAEPAKKRARMKETVSSHETRTDSDDSRSSETTTKTVHEFPSRAAPRGSPPHSTQRSALTTNDLLPPGTRGLAEPHLGDEKERSMTALGLFSFEHKEGVLQTQRSWQGANFMAALQGWSPHNSPQGGGSSVKGGRNDKGGYRVPQDMAPPKALPSPQESGLASGGVDAQGKRPPQDGSNCEVDPFLGRIAEHAAVIRKCRLLREEASTEQRPEKQQKIAELRQMQAEEYVQLQALLADRRMEKAVEQVAEERHIQGLEEKIAALQSDLRTSLVNLRKKRQICMDEDAQVHEILVTQLLPVVTFLKPASQLLLARSAKHPQQGAQTQTLNANLQTLGARSGIPKAPIFKHLVTSSSPLPLPVNFRAAMPPAPEDAVSNHNQPGFADVSNAQKSRFSDVSNYHKTGYAGVSNGQKSGCVDGSNLKSSAHQENGGVGLTGGLSPKQTIPPEKMKGLARVTQPFLAQLADQSARATSAPRPLEPYYRTSADVEQITSLEMTSIGRPVLDLMKPPQSPAQNC